jgi:hypothetical protein
MRLIWGAFLPFAVGAVFAVTTGACDSTPAIVPDAGVDSGSPVEDAGQLPEDAGVGVDAGVDAGHDPVDPPDAGHEPDAGTEDGGVDAGCGELAHIPFSDERTDIGWPDLPPTQEMPTCWTGTDDCTRFYTERFTDQATMDAWFWTEFQTQAPYQTVNWALADVVVTYNCACPTYGYTLATHQVQADDCSVLTETILSGPGESCMTWQVFNRQYSAVQIAKGAEHVTTSTVNTFQLVECGP